MLKYTITVKPVQLGPSLTEQEWAETLRRYQQARAEELKSTSPDDERYGWPSYTKWRGEDLL
ncbi:hypothetical protein FXB41_41025 [Bradyrhizobium canariense]|uniref:hypothetical protein n=1 Tax=Bradyrhizobium canariense TaxID=255045 RepID=UPI001CA5AA5A|nr:hypothetical protein [Bradyrhizobium canariense]MBW5440892.1 hypothetical protein [Bradyrhizobium canariense]